RKAFLALAVEDGIPHYAAVLSLSLEKAKNNAGIAYSKIVVSKEEELDEVSTEAALSYKQMLEPMLNAMFVAGTAKTNEDEHDEEYVDGDIEVGDELSEEPQEA